MEKNVFYTAIGFVYGMFWGGGEGAYEARKLSAETKEKIIDLAHEGIADGSLDSGMGFESLTGAVLFIEKVTTVFIDGKPFTNKEGEVVLVGDLTPRQRRFLKDLM